MASLAQEAHSTYSSVGDPTLSFSTLPSAGRCIVVCVSVYGATTGTVTGVSDNQGNGAYTKVAEETYFNEANLGASMWYKENIGSPSGTFTITVDLPGASGNYGVVTILELEGIATSGVLRDSGSAMGAVTSTDANVTTAGSAAQAGDLVVACAHVAVAGSSNVHWGAAATTGYANVFQTADYTNVDTQSVDYKVLGAGGSQSANWSHDDTTNGISGWGAVIAVFAALSAPRSTGLDYTQFPKHKLALRARGTQ